MLSYKFMKALRYVRAHQRILPSFFSLELRKLDVLGALGAISLTLLAVAHMVIKGTAVGLDSAVFFYPMYHYLGSSLRSGEIPVWNPFLFSGFPFAASPQSGWMYLPAMAFFTLLSLSEAAKTYILFHWVVSAIAVYVLARDLGLSVSGSVLASVAYSINGFSYERTVCCFAYSGVYTWVPVALLGCERAIKTRELLNKWIWIAISSFSLAQIFSAWPGQGFYYGFLLIASYLTFRILAFPEHRSGIMARITQLLSTGIIMGILAFGLGAADILPKLSFLSQSNLASGYTLQQAGVHSGWTILESLSLLGPTTWYLGVTVFSLALAAPFLVRTRYMTPFWIVWMFACLVLASRSQTLLHLILYEFLPMFRSLHPHDPERIMMTFYIAPSLLAGSTITYLLQLDRKRIKRKVYWLILIPPILLALITAYAASQITIYISIILLVFSTGLGIYIVNPSAQNKILLTLLVLACVFTDLYIVNNHVQAQRLQTRMVYALRKVNLESYYSPTKAVKFLRSQGPDYTFRFFGYDPRLRWFPGKADPSIPPPGILYRYMWMDYRTKILLVNNRALVAGIQDIQGYNPLQLSSYDSFFGVINGQSQEYRSTYVLQRGLSSPLLDLLNARYVITLRSLGPNFPEYESLEKTSRLVYEDSTIRIWERQTALPRAWIVHSWQNAPYEEVLHILANNALDFRKIALVEGLESHIQDINPSDDAVTIDHYSQSRITLTTKSHLPGMLILSEVYYPDWRAYLDGKPVNIYCAYGLLRAVTIPAGEHKIEFRYESKSLEYGLIISISFYLLVASLLLSKLLTYAKSRTMDNIRGRSIDIRN